MIVKYELKEYANQATMPDKQQTPIDASVGDVYGDIVLKIKKLLLKEGGMTLLLMVPRTLYTHFLTLLVRDMAQTGAKLLFMLARV